MKRLRSSFRGQGKWALLSAVALGLIAAPFAVAGDGDTMRVGAGNSSETAETRIIGQNVPTYATRQSNNKENDGGSATYGCRSTFAAEPCLFVFALRTARAFEFRSRGNEGGQIIVSGDTTNPRNNRPFTTNATGVATGLNADEVDGQSADAFQPRTLIAAVDTAGAVDTTRTRGVASVVKGNPGDYTVNFGTDVSKCAYTATITQIADAGSVAVAPASATSLSVRTREAGGTEANRAFHLVVNC